MQIEFWKYQANGNDFIICDNRNDKYTLTTEQVAGLCDRRFGIGADGLMLINSSEKFDFDMRYYNSDGNIGSMCGNGGRCIALCVFLNRIAGQTQVFTAADGTHHATVEYMIESGRSFQVSLGMKNVENVEHNQGFYFLDTGSPHYVEFVEKVAEIDVPKEGRMTRYSERFSPEGTNVNFVEISNERLFVRTYERGVEDETYSCGTGVTAAAIAAYLETGKRTPLIHTIGGDFKVEFEKYKNTFTKVVLKGPATYVYKGSTHL